MKYSKKTMIKLEKYIDDYIENMKNKYKEVPAIQDKINHIKRTAILVERIAPKNDLARVATKYHDIGRFLQYELLGKFDDTLVSHHVLGEDVIVRAVLKGDLKISPELDIIRSSIMYHGRMEYMPYLTELSNDVIEIVDIVSRIDGIENGCIGAIGYLERECREDAKNYKKNNPKLDMKQVSPEVLEFYLKGKKFDKMKYCKTYADYVLFANSLAITALRGKDRNIAKEAIDLECFGYKNAIEGYKDLFIKMIEPDLVDKCIECFEGFYKNSNFNMPKYVRVMDGIKSNAGGFEYKLNEINYSNNWNPNETEPDKMGGFNFGSEDKILRWLHRGDTIYDVIVPEDAEVILCDEEKGVWRANKIIVTNPRIITDEVVMELYKKTTLSNKVLAQCLQILLWRNRLEISKYIVKDRVNKENVGEFIKEFEDYNKKSEKFKYDELGQDSRIIYDMLNEIRGK